MKQPDVEEGAGKILPMDRAAEFNFVYVINSLNNLIYKEVDF